jgi:hypothetical protein
MIDYSQETQEQYFELRRNAKREKPTLLLTAVEAKQLNCIVHYASLRIEHEIKYIDTKQG